jgi:MSHA biogenesis protein MshP
VQPPLVTCFTTRTFAMPPGGRLAGFTVTVSCIPKTGNQAGDTTNRWSLEAVACNQPHVTDGCPNPSSDPDYVQRKVTAELN